MPVKTEGRSSFCMFNAETNEKLGEANDVKSIDLTINQKDTVNFKGELMNRGKRGTCALNFEKPLDTDELCKILGLDEAKMPDKYDIQVSKVVQCRRHKKKRINKKWRKKYGYRQTCVTMKCWKMYSNRNGEIEFVKDGE